MNDSSFIPALVIPGGGGSGTIGPAGPPGKDGEPGKDGAPGRDGAVYVPHIDEHRILTFTLEESPKGIPDPVDLNPYDEWSEIESGEIKTEYIWEPM